MTNVRDLHYPVNVVVLGLVVKVEIKETVILEFLIDLVLLLYPSYVAVFDKFVFCLSDITIARRLWS